MYVIDINGHEVFVEVEFEGTIFMGEFFTEYPKVKKVEVITGFSPESGYIKEIAPSWLAEMIQDPNLLLYDILEQYGTETTDEFDPETWACLPLDSE